MKKSASAFFAIFGIWSLFCSFMTYDEQSKLHSDSYKQAAIGFKANCVSEGKKIAYIDTFLSTWLSCEDASGERKIFTFDSPITLTGVSLAIMERMTFGLFDRDQYMAKYLQDSHTVNTDEN